MGVPLPCKSIIGLINYSAKGGNISYEEYLEDSVLYDPDDGVVPFHWVTATAACCGFLPVANAFGVSVGIM